MALIAAKVLHRGGEQVWGQSGDFSTVTQWHLEVGHRPGPLLSLTAQKQGEE